MQNPHFLGWSPMFHWTDSKIQVHAFYCVLAFPDRFMVLWIDFDGRQDRLERARAVIPGNLKERVFVLGVWTEPERLKANLGRRYEEIGRAAAEDCREDTSVTWGHELLQHNAGEMERLRHRVRPILFP